MAEPSPNQQMGAGEGVAPCGSPSDTSSSTADVKAAESLVTAVATGLSDLVSDLSLGQDAAKPPSEPVASAANEQANGVADDKTEGWQQREADLLKKIEELEKVKNQTCTDGLRLQLKVREEEIELLKARVKNLETELQAAMSKPAGKNAEMIENIKEQHEDLLNKARGMIFDKTKMVKNQELQIEALTTQVQSLKDINMITKDLLEIRNNEVKAMEERFQVMDAKHKAEKERHSLVLQRAQTSTNINQDLKAEYETQLKIFKELREKYDQRVQQLVAENERLKASLQGPKT
ncbi:hypothetical protein NE865_03457 [Phthorimaea operculella]|nr:hypothetical protein NE865_03457 [Phthorimaea operculella]